MDSTTEKSILEEVSTLVFDSLEKVTLKTISNNWSIKNEEAKTVLMKWLVQNKKKTGEVTTDFLITGANSKGILAFSIVPESTKKKLEHKWKNFQSFVYSVEMKSNSRKLDLPDYEPIKVKNILLNPKEPRDLHIPVIPLTIVKREPEVKKPAVVKTPFGIVKPAGKTEEKKVEVKKEIKIKTPETVVKAEKVSPEESKTAKAPVGKKNSKVQKPPQKGISSFFSGKPGTSKAAEKLKQEPTKSQEEPMIVDDESPEKAKPTKRQVTPEKKKEQEKKKEPEKKKATKKIKLKEPANNKRSRIRVMEDSSEEEVEEKSDSDEPETKFIKFDREFTPDKEESPVKEASPVKQESPEKAPNKRKAKRYVKKRFQTEDGFMRTENVLEEYSASEGETVNDENKKKNSPPKKSSATKEKPEKKSVEKKKPVIKAAQTNKITSFFTKK